MAKDTVKCRYKYCKHDSCDIPKTDAVKHNNKYFHEDCFKEWENKEKAVKLFLDLKPDTPVPPVRRIVNAIIHEKNVDAELLLFGIKYYIKHKIPLRYPGGLYYVVANDDVKAEFNKAKSRQSNYTFDVLDDKRESFVYNPSKKKSLDNFMKG